MPPVSRPCCAVVSSSIALVADSHSCIIQYVSHLHNRRPGIREERSAARIAHLSYLRACCEEFRPCRQVVNVEVALAVLAHIEVKALRTDNHAVLLGALRVTHLIHNNSTQRSRTFARQSLLPIFAQFQALHKGYHLLCYVFAVFS